MAKTINLKIELTGTVEALIPKVTEALKAQGFGVLTRIDFHSKMKEKLGKDLPPTVILGACHPQMAFEAYQKNTDFTSLVPCNAVLRQVGANQVSVELIKPTAMMELLGEKELITLAQQGDVLLSKALEALKG